MNKLLAKLPRFVLPFATRSLRGGRAERYLFFSSLLAAGVMLFSLWMALGSGGFEQNVRIGFGLERNEWTRQYQEFTLLVHDERSLLLAEIEQRELREDGGCTVYRRTTTTELSTLRDNGCALAERAAWSSPPYRDRDHELHLRARALLEVTEPAQIDTLDSNYGLWGDPEEMAALEAVLDHGGIPEVRRYESPLGLRDAIEIAGFLAGLVFAASMTVFAPLLVGMQQAQEQHENTLMPLAGTGLSARQLALGLASGPGLVVAIFAAPQLLIFGLSALFVGNAWIALATVVAITASSLFVTLAAQLLGQLVGTKRTPGIIAVSLLAMLGLSWTVGGGMAASMEFETAGFASVMPTMGLWVLLGRSFSGFHFIASVVTIKATLIWSVAAVVFAGLVLKVLTRKFEGRDGAALGPGAALLGAATCIVLIHVAIPRLSWSEAPLRMYLGLAALSLPFTALLMGRVPTGDNPSKTRRIPVPKLLLELGGWYLLHIVACATLFRFDANALHPIALLWLAWCVAVLGLMAIRVVALPSNIASHLFIGFSGATLMLGFVQAAIWGFESRRGASHVFAFVELGAIAGLLQIAVTVAVPVLLVRSLRKNLGSIV